MKVTKRTKNRLKENPNARVVRVETFRGEGVLQGRECAMIRDEVTGWLGWLPVDELNALKFPLDI